MNKKNLIFALLFICFLIGIGLYMNHPKQDAKKNNGQPKIIKETIKKPTKEEYYNYLFFAIERINDMSYKQLKLESDFQKSVMESKDFKNIVKETNQNYEKFPDELNDIYKKLKTYEPCKETEELHYTVLAELLTTHNILRAYRDAIHKDEIPLSLIQETNERLKTQWNTAKRMRDEYRKVEHNKYK